MKKLAPLAFVALVAGLGSCQTKCPAYTEKAPNRQSETVTASAARSAAERQ
ncbi:hypothetical protein [Hymenobacter edaphi]|uniref:hypothetical protein n=1 Tax=Hymenobacter edaphi TaxID=2211146 RepID=UPI0014042140|nr:hypothetical protein [Hymenobacter edaphi]